MSKHAQWALYETLLSSPANPVTGKRPHILVYGPPGTGKTTHAHNYAVPEGGLVRIQAAPGQMLGDVLGQTQLRDGSTVFLPAPSVNGIVRSARVDIAEFDRASDDMRTMCYRLCDGHPFDLPDGTTIIPGPQSQVVCSTNETPESFLAPAELDRFYLVHIPTPSAEALATLPKSWRGPAANAVERKVCGLRAFQQYAFLLSLNITADIAAVTAFGRQGYDVADALDVAAVTGTPEAQDPFTCSACAVESRGQTHCPQCGSRLPWMQEGDAA